MTTPKGLTKIKCIFFKRGFYMSILDDFIATLQMAGKSGEMTLQQTLDLILAKARRHTLAEAGSIFVIDDADGDEDGKVLKAYSLQNDRIQVNSEMFTIPVNKKSIAGYVASTGELLDIDDLYEISPEMPFTFNRTFDDKDGYRSKSMLAFPLKNFQGQIIGVVQLLNHITGVDDANVPTYGSFPMMYVDDMKNVMTVLGAMVERTALLQEIAELKAKLGEEAA